MSEEDLLSKIHPSIHQPIHYNFIPDQTHLESVAAIAGRGGAEKKKKQSKKIDKISLLREQE